MPGDATRPIALTEQVDFWTRVPPVTPLMFGGVSYSLGRADEWGRHHHCGSGRAHRQGHAYVYTGVDGAYLVLRDWGTDRQALVGRMIDRRELQVYPQIASKQ